MFTKFFSEMFQDQGVNFNGLTSNSSVSPPAVPTRAHLHKNGRRIPDRRSTKGNISRLIAVMAQITVEPVVASIWRKGGSDPGISGMTYCYANWYTHTDGHQEGCCSKD